MKEYRFKINGKDYTVCINSVSNGIADLSVNGKPYEVEIATVDNSTEQHTAAYPSFRQTAPTATAQTSQTASTTATAPVQNGVPSHPTDRPAPQQNASSQQITPSHQNAPSQPAASGKGEQVKAPLPGVIIGISVNVGDKVKEGQEVAVLEAMKMENSIEASVTGTVTAINVQKGDSVPEGAIILTIN